MADPPRAKVRVSRTHIGGKTMRYLVVLGAFLLTALSGCVSHPLTAQAFRDAVPGSMSGKVEEYEVDRPFDEVALTFQKKAPECLNVAVETTSRSNTSYQHYTATYKPTVMKSANQVEIHLQRHYDHTLKVSKEPEGGYYLLVADAFPIEGGKTRVVVYRPRMGFGVLIKAIKGWASGEQLGCPDMTKI